MNNGSVVSHWTDLAIDQRKSKATGVGPFALPKGSDTLPDVGAFADVQVAGDEAGLGVLLKHRILDELAIAGPHDASPQCVNAAPASSVSRYASTKRATIRRSDRNT